jgi:acetyl/propionyl-CoA carboxylase alpha subunit/acetyl-CoA carboxylase carboxyltransferase component
VSPSRRRPGLGGGIRCLGIANRGEAALRCLRTVKALREREGTPLEALVLYTRVERDAPFVRHADRAVELPATRGREAEAYLDARRVIDALLAGGADAVWPGWGFLSEDPAFAERVKAAGLRFLGPDAAVLRALGDKISAKRSAERLGIPVAPWSGEALEDAGAALAAARRIGFPLVIKAAAGGGGRGIRTVHAEDALPEALRAATAEAQAAFGDPRVFLERAVLGARHVEVQIAADAFGTARALGLRDCSVQRRAQKLLEEAPAPGLSRELRRALEAAALRLAGEAGYTGLGTVEFLVAGGGFVFLELNPRLQVEHGVTEETTGLDLVELQIRIARGERLGGLRVVERGAAIEARVCAEDAEAGFLPAPGRIARFDAALGPGLRIDTGFAAGSEVPAAFDSLVAKLIAHGADRAEARARLAAALRDLELVVEGGATNKGFLLDVLASEAFRRGGVDTAWLERFAAERDAGPPHAAPALVAAAILAYQRSRNVARLNFFADPSDVGPARVPPSLGQRIDLSHRGQSYQLQVFAGGSWRYRVQLDGRSSSAALREENANVARLELGGRTWRILHDANEARLRVEVEGQAHDFGWQSAGHVRAPSPAMVVAVQVRAGDRVAPGDPLGLLESMKTEIAFRAPLAGVVREVRVARGQKVAAGEVLLVIEPEGAGASGVPGAARVALDEEGDPLDLLVAPPEQGLRVRLAEADALEPALRRRALQAAREEIRRVLLGWDVIPERGERLLALLSTPLPEALSDAFRRELAELRGEVRAFSDVETLFVRAPRASVSGAQGPSNQARLRMFVRRLRAGGAGIADEFLELVRRALSHYGVDALEPGAALERAVLRLLATRHTVELRRQLVLALVRRLAALSRTGVTLGDDAGLEESLSRIAAMRGLVSDAVADAALEARYDLFQSEPIAREAERTTQRVESWLSLAEHESISPPAEVLVQLAAAPQPVFDRIGRLLRERDPRRRAIALSAHLHRLYAPGARLARVGGGIGDLPVERLELADGRCVMGVACREAELGPALEKLGRMLGAEAAIDPKASPALELFVIESAAPARDAVLRAVGAWCATALGAERLVLTFLAAEGEDRSESFDLRARGARLDLHGLHPEVAARIDLARLREFELERLPGADDLYCFRGRHREAPEDERFFVLGDVRGLAFEEGREARLHAPVFEHAFTEATRQLRAIVGTYDPRRRLHWNRLALFVAPEVSLDPTTAWELARKLHPATRHLGLEKVVVRMKLLDPAAPPGGARPVEIVISDRTGSQMEVAWREPHHAPLAAASPMERRLAESRRRGLLYPYEILRLLTGEGERPSEDVPRPFPRGRFEEWDLEPGAPEPRAVCVAGRPLGRNTCGVVFGVLETPTAKVPEGLRRVVILSDPTLEMGALGPAECDRLVAALDLAEGLRVPVEWIPVSSGARIAMASGTENLDATARVARRIVRFTQAGSTIHVIVHGVNVGAQSYFDALSTMWLHGRGALVMLPGGSMVLTGRAALEASGSVSGEDELAIGGYERVMGPNGEAHYFAHDFLDAYRILMDHYAFTYVAPGERAPRRLATSDARERDVTASPYGDDDGHGFATIGEIFDDRTNPGRKRPFSMRALLRALVDRDGGSLERWPGWVGAETAIVWDAHLGGHPVCLVGIESQSVPREGYRPADGPDAWTGGTLFPLSSKKVARALGAASGNRPVVLLANLSGFDGSPESMRKLQLEYGAEIARAVVNFAGPIVFLVVSRYHGGAYVVFSRELNPNLRAAALEGSYASVIGGGPAAAVVFEREVRARAAADARVAALRAELRARPGPDAREALERVERAVRLEKQAELAGEFDAIHTVERALRVGSLEAILPAREMRPYLIGLLDAASG